MATQAALVTPLLFIALAVAERCAISAAATSSRATCGSARRARRVRILRARLLRRHRAPTGPFPAMSRCCRFRVPCWRAGRVRRASRPQPWPRSVFWDCSATTRWLRRHPCAQDWPEAGCIRRTSLAGARLPTRSRACAPVCLPFFFFFRQLQGGRGAGLRAGRSGHRRVATPAQPQAWPRAAIAPVETRGRASGRDLGLRPVLLVVVRRSRYNYLLAHFFCCAIGLVRFRRRASSKSTTARRVSCCLALRSPFAAFSCPQWPGLIVRSPTHTSRQHFDVSGWAF